MKIDSNLPNEKQLDIIKNGFYKIPKISQIFTNPEICYTQSEYNENGKLHGKKIEKMYNTIMTQSGSEPFATQIQSVLKNHSLADDLLNLAEPEIADFLRHVFYINRGSIGWDNSDLLTSRLNQRFLPKWELPDHAIDNSFRYVLRLMLLDWSLTPDQVNLIKTVQNKVMNYQDQGYKPTEFWSKPVEMINRWNVLMLSDLYETVNTMVFTFQELDQETYLPLITHIEHMFNELLNKSEIPFVQKIVLELIFCHGMMIKSVDHVMKVKNRISELWERIEKHDEIDEQKYHWIFGSFYCQIYAKLIDFETDIVTRKMIISNVVNNYLKPSEVNFEKWKDYIISTDMHPWTFSYKIKGYTEILYTLLNHTQDLVDEVNREQILTYHRELSDFLFEVIREYAKKQGHEKPDKIRGTELISGLAEMKLPISQINTMQSTIFHVVKNHLLYHSELSGERRQSLVELNTSILETMYHQKYADIFEIEMQLNYKSDQLNNILIRIKEDVKHKGSIVNSQVFEKEILKKFSVLFNMIVNESEQKYNRLHKYSLEVLLWYLSFWYWKFQEKEINPVESTMILSPFIALLMKNLSIYYYQHHQNTKAHLMLINSYFYQSIAGLMENENRSLKDQVNSVLDQFGNSYNRINFKLKDTSLKLKEFTTKSMKFPKQKSGSIIDKSYHDYDIDENAIFKYMELRDQYHDFITKSQKMERKELIKLIHSCNLYSLPEQQSPILMQKIGKNISEEVLRAHPFPLIRNLHKYGIAIKLFPVTVELPKFEIDMEF